MSFEFATAGRIVFGMGGVRGAAKIVRSFGQRALLVSGKNRERSRVLEQDLQTEGVRTEVYSVHGEPTVADARAAAARGRAAGCEVVVGMGGGSALDTAKAAAALLANPGDLFDYLEVIGRGQALPHPALPCIAIPTTAGTGSEVTRNAVLASPEHHLKVSLRSPGMLPRVALVDPELTLNLPPALTASTGCDALAQLIEPFVCLRANPLTDGICREGLRRAAKSLRRAYEEGADAAAREDMALASLFGGLALANAGLGAVHGLASPLGGRFHAAHGAVCGILLAPVMDMNLRVGGPATAARLDEIARILTGNPSARAQQGIAWVRALVSDLHLPGLSAYGVASADLLSLADAALSTSSMKANPARLDLRLCAEIAEAAL